jgi:DNA-binding protein H-NS
MSKVRGRRHTLAARPVPVKYRDGNGNAWSVRGRPPLWLAAAEKAGKKRESFLIGAKVKTKPPRRKKAAKKKAATAS